MSLVPGIWGAFVVEAMLQMQGGALLRQGMPEKALAVQTQAGVPSDAGVESPGWELRLLQLMLLADTEGVCVALSTIDWLVLDAVPH